MLRTWSLIGSLLLVASTARAALTDSEKLQISTFVAKGAIANAPRVRALVARPDLAPEEAAEPLKRGFSSAPFDDTRQKFADALLFGPGSAASRNALVSPLVEALLARAASRMGDIPAEPKAPLGQSERKAADEVIAIHAFIDRRIANYGAPPADGHDASSAIRDDAFRAAAQSLKAHRDAHARWLTAGTVVPADIVHLRAQIALTLIDLARGVVGRHEVSTWLGLDGSRREAFERYGLYVEATAPDARIADALRVLASVPGAPEGVSLLLLTKASPAGIAARGLVASAGVDLGAAVRQEPSDKLWPVELKPAASDVALAQVAQMAAELGVRRSLERRPELATRAAAAAGRAARTGSAGYLSKALVGMALEGNEKAPRAPSSPEVVLAGAVQLLLIDGQRALELSLIRAAEGRPEPLEQFATALAVLAGDGSRVSLGRTRDDGSLESDPATEIKVEDGVATAFVLRGKHVTVLAAKNGAFEARIDGAAPKLTSLASYRERTSEADSMHAGSVSFETLFGAPKGASLDDGRLVLEGSKGGFDAVATGEPMDDGEVTARIRPKGAGGGLLLRATSGDISALSVALLLSADTKKASLVTFDGRGKAFEIAEAVPLAEAPKDGYAVSLGVVGSTVGAKIDGKAIVGNLRIEIPQGKAGLAVLSGGRVEVSDFKALRCSPNPVQTKSSPPPALTPTGFCAKPVPAKAKGKR
jgi:hypothetical protein